MADKKFLQACEAGGSIYGRKRMTGREAAEKNAVNKEDLMAVYNRFYKNQVAALYKIISEGK